MTADGAEDNRIPDGSEIKAAVDAKTESEHDTLKYHLLGPSLTKAGQDKVDQQKVSEVIYNASKGSKYFNNEEYKDKNLTQKIEKILARKKQLERVDLASDLRRADEYIAELELTRDLSQTIVHIDCDAFYAAVEELDRPELKHVPMAVGKGVLTTCNYHARKFGCRSGMAGFVATKLCPQLICLPLNFEKYTAKAQEVREILADYDPRFESASIDEAYLNITQYCTDNEIDPEEAVTQLRNEVHEKTHITISAGIAPNGKIAKIASNRNKPNGQFRVANDRTKILSFMRDLPTRKVNGVGRVFERELDAIGVKVWGDIYPRRAYLSKLFGEKAFLFLMQCYLGLGRTMVQPAEEHERKSVGTESTFRDMSDKSELRTKLRWIAEELEKDLTRTQFKGRTLVLKIKLHTYEVFTRQVIPPKAVSTADDLYTYSLPMMTKLEKEIPSMKLRLMGLRCTHLISTKKPDTDNFFGLRRLSSIDETELHSKISKDQDGEWEVWPEAEFEEAARQERQDDLAETERLSQEHLQQDHQGQDQGADSTMTQEARLEESNRRHKHGREILPNPSPSTTSISTPPAKVASIPRSTTSGQKIDSGIGFSKPATNPYRPPKTPNPKKEEWICPICKRPQEASDAAFNQHVDFCLSRQVIREAAGEDAVPSLGEGDEGTVEEEKVEGKEKENGIVSCAGSGRGSASRRGRPKGKRKSDSAGGDDGRRNKKLFFGVKGM